MPGTYIPIDYFPVLVVFIFALLIGLVGLDQYKKTRPTTAIEIKSEEIPFEIQQVEV